MRKPVCGGSDTNRAAQSQMMAKGLIFLGSRGIVLAMQRKQSRPVTAKLICIFVFEKPVFSRPGSFSIILDRFFNTTTLSTV